MTKETMKAVVKNYADTCSRLYTGGEEYFNEIDAKIKGNIDLLLSYIQTAVDETGCKNIVLSGGMFETVFKAIKTLNKRDWSLFKVSGGLRNYKYIFKCPEEFAFMYYGKDFIFIDDSFYSGKTLEQVKTFIESAGGKIVATYVFYDGSKEKRKDVHSLYRYYDNDGHKKSIFKIDEEDCKKDRSWNEIVEYCEIDSDGRIKLHDDILAAAKLSYGQRVKISLVEVDGNENDLCISIEKAYDKEKMKNDVSKINDIYAKLAGKNIAGDIIDAVGDVLYEMIGYLEDIIDEV